MTIFRSYTPLVEPLSAALPAGKVLLDKVPSEQYVRKGVRVEGSSVILGLKVHG